MLDLARIATFASPENPLHSYYHKITAYANPDQLKLKLQNCQTQKELLRFIDYLESNISYQLTMCV